MDLLSGFLDLILHLDQHLRELAQSYGAWVYAVLFLIVFLETGVVVTPFLPGDSLLFTAGLLCSTKVHGTVHLSLPAILVAAAAGAVALAAAAGLASVGPQQSEVNERRRGLVWFAVTGFLTAWFLAFLRFFLPRTLFEPPTIFKIGYHWPRMRIPSAMYLKPTVKGNLAFERCS
jgi:membrane protein DedA with SNARE-associated domain